MSSTFGKLTRQILSKRNPFLAISRFKKSKAAQIPESDFVILKANRDEYHDILKLMHEAYYPFEPVSYALNIKGNPILDEYVLNSLTEGLSFVARNKYDGCVIGAAINATSSPWDPDFKEKLACGMKCPKIKQYILFDAFLQRMPNIWEKCGVPKVYEIEYIFIHPRLRRLGIAQRLWLESRELGTDCGYKIIRCDATSLFLSKICEKNGMDKIAELPYCSYLGKNLEPVLKAPIPHDAVRIYMERDPQKRKI